MRGVVFLGGRKLELREFPDPTPGAGEVVVAMKASGMCGSDLHTYRAVCNAAAALGRGRSGDPIVAGHEPGAVVSARGTCAIVIASAVAQEQVSEAMDLMLAPVVTARESVTIEALQELTRGVGAEADIVCTGNPNERVGSVRSGAT